MTFLRRHFDNVVCFRCEVAEKLDLVVTFWLFWSWAGCARRFVNITSRIFVPGPVAQFKPSFVRRNCSWLQRTSLIFVACHILPWLTTLTGDDWPVDVWPHILPRVHCCVPFVVEFNQIIRKRDCRVHCCFPFVRTVTHDLPLAIVSRRTFVPFVECNWKF